MCLTPDYVGGCGAWTPVCRSTTTVTIDFPSPTETPDGSKVLKARFDPLMATDETDELVVTDYLATPSEQYMTVAEVGKSKTVTAKRTKSTKSTKSKARSRTKTTKTKSKPKETGSTHKKVKTRTEKSTKSKAVTVTSTSTQSEKEEPTDPPSDDDGDENDVKDPPPDDGDENGGKNSPEPQIKDMLYSLIVQAIENAARMLREQYKTNEFWDTFTRDAEEHRDRDDNGDGNTPGGLAWLVRKELGWPAKIAHPESPQYLEAAMALEKYSSERDIEEIVLKKYLDALDAGNETNEQPVDASSLFYISDMFTTNASKAAIGWEDFKKAAAWQIDSNYRPLVLLKHVEIDPPIEPQFSWMQTVQIYINKHIPYEQTWPLPSEVEQALIMELDVAFNSMLQRIKDGASEDDQDNQITASDDDILEELRYVLLHQNLTDPIFVAATEEDIETVKKEFLRDGEFLKEVRGKGTISALFSDDGFRETLKDHIRITKIKRESLHSLAVKLETPIIEGLRQGGIISGKDDDQKDDDQKDDDQKDDDQREDYQEEDGKDDEDQNPRALLMSELLPKLEPRGDAVTAKKNQRGSSDEGVDGHQTARWEPFLTPKEIRRMCLLKCSSSILKEPCAC